MVLDLEPFPLFIDSAPAEAAKYFDSSKMSSSLETLLPTPAAKKGKPRTVSLPSKLSNYLHLRYYQYEVSFGLYMLTPGEKIVLNGIILAIFTALSCALFWGLEPFVVRSICRLVYYLVGSVDSTRELCEQ